MKSEKGFIQISLLTAIIISIVAGAVITTGIVLDKQKKTTPTTANISEVFEEVGEKVPKEELQEESQILEESQTEFQPTPKEPSQPISQSIIESEPEPQPKKLINPTITTISPNEILSNIDATITINGENFRPGAILIIGNLISGENFGEVNIVSDKIITFEYPRDYLMPASYNITINNTDGSKITSDGVLKIIDAATQSSSPSQESITEETELGAEPIKEEETKNKEVEKITGTEVGGIISENTTWTLENNPYILTSTVQVPLGVTLTIKPGVMVTKPTSGDMFLINGTIHAHGIKGNKITFDGGDNSDFFHITGSDSAFLDLEYCIVKNGLMFWPGGNHNGHFHLQHSELINLAEQSTLWFPSGNIDINYNKFVNTYGFRIYTDNDVKVHIKNNLFYKGHPVNYTDYWNFYIIVMSQDSSEVTIKYNSFLDMGNIVLKLSDDSINTFSASGNYWGTQDENVIKSMIHDRNDDIRCTGYINYLPILKESHPNTPKL